MRLTTAKNNPGNDLVTITRGANGRPHQRYGFGQAQRKHYLVGAEGAGRLIEGDEVKGIAKAVAVIGAEAVAEQAGY